MKIRFNEQPLDPEVDRTLFEHADRLGIRIPSGCGRVGSCHECIVEVTRGAEALSPKTCHEDFLRGNYRLACQCRLARGNVEIHVHALRRGRPQIAESGRVFRFELDPCVRRGEGGAVSIDGEPVGISDGPLAGVAIDVGTTTVVLRLVNLETGAILARQSFENPQMFGGPNVMSRIGYEAQSGRRELQTVLIAYINDALKEMAMGVGISRDDIYEVLLVGNSTMRELAMGLDVQGLGARPFQSLSERRWRAGKCPSTAVTERPGRLRLWMNRRGRAVGAPLIACHVGADTLACLTTIDIDRREDLVMLMDIGTNTELVLGNRHRILCASCPAGPAFEGGSIGCGMPGLDGAIETIRINDEVQYETIGGGPPMGICGSGMIDAMGDMLETGRINLMGRFADGHDRFWIDPEHEIYISQADLAELAQAKAANIAGVALLLEQYGVGLGQVEKFYLAGGFANYINVAQTMRIGMIPQMPETKVEKIGNAAIEGATALLCSAALRRRAERLAARIEHIELETLPGFFPAFVEGCQFKPLADPTGPLSDAD